MYVKHLSIPVTQVLCKCFLYNNNIKNNSCSYFFSYTWLPGELSSYFPVTTSHSGKGKGNFWIFGRELAIFAKLNIKIWIWTDREWKRFRAESWYNNNKPLQIFLFYLKYLFYKIWVIKDKTIYSILDWICEFISLRICEFSIVMSS